MRQVIAFLLLFFIPVVPAINASAVGENITRGLLAGVDVGCSVAADLPSLKLWQTGLKAHKKSSCKTIVGLAMAGSVGDMLSKIRDPFVSRQTRAARFAADAFRTLTYVSPLKEKQEELSNKRVLFSSGLRLVGAFANLYAISRLHAMPNAKSKANSKLKKQWAWSRMISSLSRAGADCMIGNNTIRFGSLLAAGVDVYAMFEVINPKAFIQTVDNCSICQFNEKEAPFSSNAFECSQCHKKIHADCYADWISHAVQMKEEKGDDDIDPHRDYWPVRGRGEWVEIRGKEYSEQKGCWWRQDRNLQKRDKNGKLLDYTGWLFIRKLCCPLCKHPISEKDYYHRAGVTVK
ncbi:hypothetical protein KAT92_00805 [Candidatus Babeliales bacterium]|nr:hypothetical protein [Candidatus Babeliales bacterium]